MPRSLARLFGLFALPTALASAAGAHANPFPSPAPSPTTAARADTAIFAGGCFWGVEAVFEHLNGVVSATSGYAGGTVADPSYEQVSAGDTGHAESVQVVFDPSRISYGQLLQVFFAVAHDPTQLNRQGPDVGTQYRSAIFFRNDQQRREAEAYVAQLRASKSFSRPIVTRIEPLRAFYAAEAYHQNYMAQHPNQLYIVVNDRPKVEHLRTQFPALYRD